MHLNVSITSNSTQSLMCGVMELHFGKHYPSEPNHIRYMFLPGYFVIFMNELKKGRKWSSTVLMYLYCYCIYMYTYSSESFLQGLKGQQILELIECGGRLDRPDKCQQGVYEIMLRCWTYE